MTPHDHTPVDRDSRLRDALRAARMSSFTWDLESDSMVRDGDVESIYGVPADTLGNTGDRYLRLLHPDDRDRLRSRVSALSLRNPALNVEYRVLLPNGAIRWFADDARAEFDAGGRLTRLTGFTLDQ
jgi:PAS domain-containing protein